MHLADVLHQVIDEGRPLMFVSHFNSERGNASLFLVDRCHSYGCRTQLTLHQFDEKES